MGGVLLLVSLLAGSTPDGGALAAAAAETLPPPRLRTCCAFGYDLQTEVGGEPLPTTVANVVSPWQLGPHHYLEAPDRAEQNGLVYTCRAGFIDVSHVRDYADWTRYLYARLRPVLGSAVRFSLPDEGGARTVVLRAVDVEADEARRDEVARRLAQRLAFELSLLHEVVTWYDYRSVPFFSERVSAFSPEDVPSNAVGVAVGAEALRRGGDFDAQVDALLRERLDGLDALSPAATRRAFDLVEGAWWDRTRALPDLRVVTRRNVALGPVVTPWTSPSQGLDDCRHRGASPVSLEVPEDAVLREGAEPTPLTELFELRFAPDYATLPRFPRPEHEPVTQRDLPFLAERVRDGLRAELGPLVDAEPVSLEALAPAAPELPCGLADPDCSRTRRLRQNGTRLLRLELGTWAFLSLIGGVTVADFVSLGGSVQLLDYRSMVAMTPAAGGAVSYLMRVEALRTTGLLSACRHLADDGSGRTVLALTIVDPLDDTCLPGARWGLKLDALDLIYDGRAQVFGLRPVELGVAWNLLGNGYSADYFDRRLIWSLNLTPELYVAPGTASVADAVLNTRLAWHQSVWASRFTLGGDFQASWGLGRTSLVVEAVARVSYNQLLSFGRGRERKHTILSFGFEGGIDWWPTNARGLAPLNHRGIQVLSPTGPPDFYGVANFVIELSVPGLTI